MPKNKNQDLLSQADALINELRNNKAKFNREFVALPELLGMSPLSCRIKVIDDDADNVEHDVPWVDNSCEFVIDTTVEENVQRDAIRAAVRQAIAFDLTDTIMNGDTDSDDPELRIMDGWIKLRAQKRDVIFEVNADVRVELILDDSDTSKLAYRFWTRLRAVPT